MSELSWTPNVRPRIPSLDPDAFRAWMRENFGHNDVWYVMREDRNFLRENMNKFPLEIPDILYNLREHDGIVIGWEA